MKIGLITCTKHKQEGTWPAELLYNSLGFAEHLAYAKNHYDQVFIVSARYGLVDLEQILPQYDRALVLLDDEEQNAWAIFVVACVRQYLRKQGVPEAAANVFVHADELYRSRLRYALARVKMHFEEFDFGTSLPQ